jgi:hypothetical protein
MPFSPFCQGKTKYASPNVHPYVFAKEGDIMSLLVTGSFVRLNETIQVMDRLNLSGSNASIRGENVHVILTSSAGSQITVSGTLRIAQGTGFSALAVNSAGTALTISASAGVTVQTAATFSNTAFFSNAVTFSNTSTFNGQSSFNGLMSVNAGVNVNNNGKISINYATGSAEHIRAVGTDLILSASSFLSESCVAISGVLKVGHYSTASLPQTAFTGTIIWLIEPMCFAGYGSEGWMRFLTGAI